jgi:hypothetical protein
MHITEPLPSVDRRDTNTDVQTEGLIKYATEMGSSAIIYIPGFIKNDSGIQTLMGWGIHRCTDTQTACRSHKPTLTFSKKGK